MTRREFYRFGSIVLATLVKLLIAVPAIAFLISPLRRKKGEANRDAFETLTNLSHLSVGVPQSFAIIKNRTDAWVKYPSEPVGSIWLVRQPKGVTPEVIALSAECPHLGCAINLTPEGKGFLCPCHSSAFDLQGRPQNQVPPRPMDRLDVALTAEPDPKVQVKFQRFQPLAPEKIPLA
ncbi:MAG: Rieske 2Fe-2S domain-containing protein [Planctomycetaceae bacterium]|nr:Rieske 2Fe-2S domain-containing protein [Planctomycetaceae bacterium]